MNAGVIVWNAIKHDFTEDMKNKYKIDIYYSDTCSIINNKEFINNKYNTNSIVKLKKI